MPVTNVEAVWESGDLVFKDSSGTELFKIGATGATGVLGLSAGLKIASGTVTLDGSNPTPVTTGLTTVVSATATLKATAAPGADPTTFSVGYSGGTLNIYAWKITSATDGTLIASANSTATVDWIAIGS